mmetsp:Transcript_26314/g.77216  ORF Transcript_26314/g.77216 Transcript_26314/m.77216 type:complete len:367 (-) Transcript_26314:176-1276(-)
MASKLFLPGRIGSLSLANKFVMAPLTRSRADPMGVPGDITLDYYSQRAGAGMIIAEGTQPSFMGQGYCRTPGIHTDDQIAAWRRITDAVHSKGAKIFLQIMHAGRIAHHDNRQVPDDPVAPSAIAAKGEMYTDKAQGMVPMPTPRALETGEVPRVIDEFVAASENAVLKAGFDGVELHAANGYLLNQFLSTNSNARDDIYGGSVSGRIRAVVDTVDAVRGAIGADRTAIRVSPGHMYNDLIDENPVETHAALLTALKTEDLAYVHFMLANAFAEALNNFGDADDVLPSMRPLVKCPLLAAGQLTLETADELVEKGLIDLPVFGRPFLANPDLVERYRTGKPLAEPKPEFFFTPGPEGYIDYPVAGA